MLAGGCAQVPPDGGLAPVAALARDRLDQDLRPARSAADAAAIDDLVRERLGRPLDADGAVQVALLADPHLRAAIDELAIAEADRAQAGLLPNPGFRFKHTREGGDVIVERLLAVDLVRLLTLPATRKIGDAALERTRLEVAAEVMRTATAARIAFYEAVAAAQAVEYAGQVALAADASAELASQMRRAGNWSALDAARQSAFQADAAIDLARARAGADVAREKLVRALGVDAERSIELPGRLPEVPPDDGPSPIALGDAERFALAHRFDVEAARRDTARLAASLGLARTTRWIDVLELGLVHNSQSGLPEERGYEVSLEVPLFDWGEARVARAEALYMQSVHRLGGIATDARAEVRTRWHAWRTAGALARRYRDEIVPLRKAIAEQSLLRYNGMLESTFDLLADAREQVAGVNGYIAALREYWTADASLREALGGAMPPPAASAMEPS